MKQKSRPFPGGSEDGGLTREFCSSARRQAFLLDSTLKPIFFVMVPLMKPRTLCASQSVAAMISLSVAPSLRRSRSRMMAFLLPSRAVGAAVSAVASLLGGAASGATLAACGAAVAVAFCFSAAVSLASVCRNPARRCSLSAASASFWMAVQIRLVAVFRIRELLNRL